MSEGVKHGPPGAFKERLEAGVVREVCAQHLAGYKIPKSFVRTPKVMRSPAGKADYRWAKQVAARDTHTHHDDRDTAAAL